MSQITFIPGPIDALREGLSTGLRMASLKAGVNQQRLRNQLGQQELQLAISRFGLETKLAASEIDLRETTALKNRLDSERAFRFLEQGGVAKELAGVEAQTGERQARAAGTRSQTQIDFADAVSGALESFGDDISIGGAIEFAKTLGSGSPEVLGPMILADFLNDKKEFERLEALDQTNQAYRQLLGLAAAERSKGVLTPLDRADLSALESIDKQIGRMRLIQSLGGMGVEGIKLGKVEAELTRLLGERAKARESLGGGGGSTKTPPGPLEKDPVSGLRIIRGDEDLPRINPGEDFIGPDGIIRTKPR